MLQCFSPCCYPAERVKEMDAKLTRIEGLVGRWRAEPWDITTALYKTCADELAAILAPVEGVSIEPPSQEEGLREHQPTLCWRIVAPRNGCILERGHDDGIHEPVEQPKESTKSA